MLKGIVISELRYQVQVHDGLPGNRELWLLGRKPIVSLPIASTLIFGDHDAVLVDPPFTHDQIQRTGDWIETSGKQLTSVFATHVCGDHWFGTDLLLQRFPGAIAYASSDTIAKMHEQATESHAKMWDISFPDQIPSSPVFYQTVPTDGFKLEDQRLVVVEVGNASTADTTVLHAPSIGLVVAGDIVYNGVHQNLLSSAHGGIKSWLRTLNNVAELNPRAVVARHKKDELPDHPATITETRDYLLDAQRLLAGKPSPREFFDHMIQLHPRRLNVDLLWDCAVALLSDDTFESYRNTNS